MSQHSRIFVLKKPSEKLKLTDSLVSKSTPRTKEYSLKDTEIKGLYLRVRPSGSKVFYVIKGKYKHSLGSAEVLSVKTARAKARLFLATDADLKKAIKKLKPTHSLDDLYVEYFKVNPELSSGYKLNMEQTLRVFSKVRHIAVTQLDTDTLLEILVKARGKYQDATVDTAVNSCNALLNYAIAIGVLDKNPAENIRKRGLRLNINIRDRKLTTEQDFQRFFTVLKQSDDVDGWSSARFKKSRDKVADSLLFMLLTGCRMGEALKLKVDNINFNQENVRDAEGRIKPRTLTFKDTKNGTDHTLQMTPLLNALVSRNLEKGNPYVFRCKGVSFRAQYSRVLRLIDKVGIRCHDLRRTFAYWASTVMREYEVSIILNHTNKRSNMTERYIGEHTDKTLALLHAYQKKIQRFNYRDANGVRTYGFKDLIPYGFEDEEIVPLVDLEKSEKRVIGNYQSFYS